MRKKTVGKMLSPILRECAPPESPGGQRIGYKCPGCGQYHVLPVHDPLSEPQHSPSWAWDQEGDKPTISPSVRTAVCHHYVSEGRIQFLGDSQHPLAGMTVDMIPWTLDEADEH